MSDKTNTLEIAPSILAGDFGCLADEARRIADAGANCIHLDIMDGHFVPNITMGPQAVAAINRATDLFLDVHLMIYNPYDYVERFVEAGANRITFHFEATEDVIETLEFIRRCNVQAGLAFCPETSISFVPKFLDQCDLLLMMTVHPGFGGQSFMPEVVEKVKLTREFCQRLNIRAGGVTQQETSTEPTLPPFLIQVDGGINYETAELCAEAGANSFVSGSFLLGQKDLTQSITQMREVVSHHISRL